MREHAGGGGYVPGVLNALCGSRLRDLLVIVALSGCGAATPPRSKAPPRPKSHASAAAEPSAPACRIESVRAEQLEVRPEGQAPFLVAVSDGALHFRLTENGEVLDAEVEHPLRFHARAPVEEQRLVIRAERELAAGSLHLVPDVPVIGLARAEHGVAAELQLGRREPDNLVGVELAVGPVTIPCELVVPEEDPLRSRTALPRHVSGGELRVAGVLPLSLRPLRVAPTEVEIRPAHRDDFVPVWMVDRQGESARVIVEFGDGAELVGWVPLSALRDPSTEEAEQIDRMVHEEGSSAVSYGTLGLPQLTEPGPQADEYVGSASLRPDSEIFAQPGEGAWARSVAQPLEVRVRWQRRARFAQLLDVPGMSIEPEHTWVARGDLSIPEP